MSMTESKYIQVTFDDAMYCAKTWVGEENCEECRLHALCHTYCDDASKIMVQALEELKQYRAIGTVSEFAELKEKATAKKPIEIFEENIAGIGDEKIRFGGCPGCGMEVQDSMKYCMSCGTALDWSEGKE